MPTRLSIATSAALAPACGGVTAGSGNGLSGVNGTGATHGVDAGSAGAGGMVQGTVPYPPGTGGATGYPYPVGTGGTTGYPYPVGTGGAGPCGGHVCGVIIQPTDAGAARSDAGAADGGAGVFVPPGLTPRPSAS